MYQRRMKESINSLDILSFWLNRAYSLSSTVLNLSMRFKNTDFHFFFIRLVVINRKGSQTKM
jgi:hypothetical protein